jgi:hypothetical protein
MVSMYENRRFMDETRTLRRMESTLFMKKIPAQVYNVKNIPKYTV